ncbi:MerC domain-containing protein [Sphingomonas sp. ID0503]|uniref:MerC domain-containing protein n=1 Tax=Sphingomonas sp. ID0503 TaxID=3399691 RepID=UPI003AFA0508
MQQAAPSPSLDRYGVALSLLCLAHCLALPFLFAMLPAAAVVLPSSFAVHLILFGLALPISGLALALGYRRHRRLRPLLLGGIGLGLICGALFVASLTAEIALTVTGGLIVVTAHALNRAKA